MIEIRSDAGTARISRYGAQVLDATLRGRRLLWAPPGAIDAADTRDAANERSGKAVRGGVPVCFPWFGPHPDGLPQHGFARTRVWDVRDQRADRVVFELSDDEGTRALWPHAFRAELAIEIGEVLAFALTVDNTGAAAFTITYALHSYLAAPAATAFVDGLDGRARREGGLDSVQSGPVWTARPLDAIFPGAPPRVTLHDGAGGRIGVEADAMPSTIVWNPGPNDVADIGDGWRDFVCVERGRVGSEAVTLSPGARHTATMRLSV